MNGNFADATEWSRTSSTVRNAAGVLLSESAATQDAGRKTPYDLWLYANVIYRLKELEKGKLPPTVALGYNFRNNRNISEETLSSDGTERLQSSTNTEQEHRLSLSPPAVSFFRDQAVLHTDLTYIYRDYDDRTVLTGSAVSGLQYWQHVASLSGSFSGTAFGGHVGYRLAVLADYNHTDGRDLSTGMPLDRREWDIHPSVSAGYSFLKPGIHLSMNYSPSVKRPNFNQLNPYRDLSDPTHVYQGNPNLGRSVTHNIGLGLSYMKTRGAVQSVSLSYRLALSTNLIEQVTFVGADQVAVSTFANLGSRRSHIFRLQAVIKPVKGLRLRLDGNYSLSTYGISAQETNRTQGFRVRLEGSYSVAGWSFSGRFALQPTASSVQNKLVIAEPDLSLTVGKYFPKPRLGFGLHLTDLLHGRSFRRSVIGSDAFLQETLTQRLGRNVSLSVYWRLGRFREPKRPPREDAYDQTSEE